MILKFGMQHLVLEFYQIPSHNDPMLNFAPQYFYTDRSKAVLLLWFLTVTCS